MIQPAPGRERPFEQQSQGDIRGGMSGIKDAARDVAQTVKKGASQAVSQAQESASEALEHRKNLAADKLEHLAQAMRRSADDLSRNDDPDVARIATQAARQVERVSDYVRQHDLRHFIGQVEDFGRRHPVWFLGGAFVAGVIVARFIKSSGARRADGSGSDNLLSGSDAFGDQGHVTTPDSRSSSSIGSPGSGEPLVGGLEPSRFGSQTESPAASSDLEPSSKSTSPSRFGGAPSMSGSGSSWSGGQPESKRSGESSNPAQPPYRPGTDYGRRTNEP